MATVAYKPAQSEFLCVIPPSSPSFSRPRPPSSRVAYISISLPPSFSSTEHDRTHHTTGSRTDGMNHDTPIGPLLQTVFEVSFPDVRIRFAGAAELYLPLAVFSRSSRSFCYALRGTYLPGRACWIVLPRR